MRTSYSFVIIPKQIPFSLVLFQNCQFGTTTVAQRIKLMALIPIYICIQWPSTKIHFVVDAIYWYCAKRTHTTVHQLRPIIVASALSPSTSVSIKSHGLVLNKSTHCWTLTADHWDGQRTDSQAHKDRTTVVLVPTKSTDVMSSMPITVHACTLAWKSAAQMLKWCRLNGNTKSVHVSVSRPVTICGFPDSCCTESPKTLV